MKVLGALLMIIGLGSAGIYCSYLLKVYSKEKSLSKVIIILCECSSLPVTIGLLLTVIGYLLILK